MNKVYVAGYSYEYEGDYIIGVYTTRKRAQDACDRFEDSSYDTWIAFMELNADYRYGRKVRDGE